MDKIKNKKKTILLFWESFENSHVFMLKPRPNDLTLS